MKNLTWDNLHDHWQCLKKQELNLKQSPQCHKVQVWVLLFFFPISVEPFCEGRSLAIFANEKKTILLANDCSTVTTRYLKKFKKN